MTEQNDFELYQKYCINIEEIQRKQDEFTRIERKIADEEKIFHKTSLEIKSDLDEIRYYWNGQEDFSRQFNEIEIELECMDRETNYKVYELMENHNEQKKILIGIKDKVESKFREEKIKLDKELGHNKDGR